MTQAKKIYKAEAYVPYVYSGPRFDNAVEATYRLRDIERSDVYKALSIPPIREIVFVDKNPNWTACYKYFDKSIYMTPEGNADLLLLHELAHHVWHHKYPVRKYVVDPHGKHFAGIYRRLVYHFVSEQAFGHLSNAFLHNGVRFI